MRMTRRQLRHIIKEELMLEALSASDHDMLDEAFEAYMTVYKNLARRSSGHPESMNKLWDQVTRQVRELINEESFRAHGRMHLGTTADRKPRVFR